MPDPLGLFHQHGDLERAMLRRGNRNSAKFWHRVLLPVPRELFAAILERILRFGVPPQLVPPG